MTACNSTTNLKSLPSIKDLNTWFNYDPDTGILTWREKPTARGRKSVAIGDKVGSLQPIGYLLVMVRRNRLYVHRIAWAISTGSWPEEQIDHINGIRDDNRLCNLRAVSPSENLRNKKINKNNTTGVTGVCKPNKQWGKPYLAYGRGDQGKTIYLGFSTLLKRPLKREPSSTSFTATTKITVAASNL